ncbi:MAG TPA: Hsp70 family protein [bacterium]|nr:Hsp70 family protein [bacterium]HQO33604.1 Hsp70 family protein [bacterium]HQP97213.1 Hsp70 family protein [bacterium]
MGIILGIDLGTTNSVMAYMDNGKPTILPNDLGDRLTPSIVHFAEDGDILVGKKARRAAALNPDRTIFSIKRRMGTKYRVNIDGIQRTPQEISSIVLQKLKTDAENYLGQDIEQAVITVPAYFTDAQRQATRDAGMIAGFRVRRIIDEPTAAAISYGLDKESDQILMVYDFGGGTFDVSIIEMVGGVFQVLSIKGNNKLGGDDLDERIVEFLLAEVKRQHGLDLTKDARAMFRLRDASQEAKIELSGVTKTHILVEAVAMTQKGPVTVDTELTRAKFESLTGDLLESTIGPSREAIIDAGLQPDDISNVLLVGGTTRIPYVQQLVRSLINKEPRKDVSPDECVALGAAIQASILAPLDDELESTAAESVQTDGPVIVHLTPFSLGVGLAEDRYGVLIERNSTYPTEARDLFTTTRDFQTAISFPVYEGEESVASANTFLDMLRIDGIPPAPRGVPRIEVTFRLNQDRILEATATDLTTNKEVSVTILSTDNRLAPEEVKRLTDEARKRVAEIMKLRQRDNLVNEAESLIYRAERMFGEFDDALSESARRVVDELKTAKESNDHDRMGEIMGELNELLTRMETADY